MTNNNAETALEKIIEKSDKCSPLTKEDLVFLLSIDDVSLKKRLFEAARDARSQHFDNKIFLYGFLYLSTYCRNRCRFCYFRNPNMASRRYRKDNDEVVEAAKRLAASGVHLIDLTMGEDPYFLDRGEKGFKKLTGLISEVKSETSLPVMISPGVVPDILLGDFSKAGADWYACYQETHNRKLFSKLRLDQNYDERIGKKYSAHNSGLLIEEGILTGVGDHIEDIADSIIAMREMDADQIRVMSFVPQEGTPLFDKFPADPQKEIQIIAVLRMAFPDRLIPASLDIDGLDGLKPRLDAGANVVTSLVPPGQGLAGVAQSELDIEEDRRSVESVKRILSDESLRVATVDEYKSWIKIRCSHVDKKTLKESVAC
ncbi:MAG: methylornithine synthase PylB [Desulfobacterales bacterium]|nr:methylornithine synthase PylB [Desulfobacterales bacterium]